MKNYINFNNQLNCPAGYAGGVYEIKGTSRYGAGIYNWRSPAVEVVELSTNKTVAYAEKIVIDGKSFLKFLEKHGRKFGVKIRDNHSKEFDAAINELQNLPFEKL
jgi:hypothetical protein